MAARTIRNVGVAVGLVLALGLSLFAVPPSTRPTTLLSPDATATYKALLTSTARASWAGQTPGGPEARVVALVQLEQAPLALVGGAWSHEQRAAYAAEVAAARRRLASAVAALGGSVLAEFSHAAAGLAVTIRHADLAALGALPGVAAVVRVGDYTTTQATTPGRVATQAELSALLGADEVRSRGNDGTGIEIAIVDSGVDYTHLKLGGSGNPADYERAACGVPGPGETGCDPGFVPPADLFPNGKVRGGLDLVGDVWPNPDPRCGTQEVCPVFDPNPIDLSGHGTHMADIAAGLPTAPEGDDLGIAPGANLWAFKACNGEANVCSGVALLSAIDAALDLDRSDSGACQAGDACNPYDPADIIVLAASFSYGQPEDAVGLFANLASFYGSLVVAAAGNDGDRPYIVSSPAIAAAAMAVAESALPEADGASEAVSAEASRGPRINDSALKPDLAAPGAVLSAEAGGGSATTAFGGSSGAAPATAGVAALIVQELEERGVLDPSPGLADPAGEPRLSLAPLVKAVLMNNAQSELGAPGGGLAPLTLQGAGRVDADATFLGRTLALDATEMVALLASDPELNRCTIRPYLDLLAFRLLGQMPPCAALYPGGDPLFQAWNAQTGSVSFGYQPALVAEELARQVVVVNYSRSPRSYSLSTGLRFADDEGRGVALRVTPDRLDLAGGEAAIVSLTLTIDPAELRDWTLNGGELGDQGSASCTSPSPEQDCPSLTLFEVDGALVIDGGTNNRISVPVYVLPRKVAAVEVTRLLETQVLLANASAYHPGEVTPYALVDISPNRCDTFDEGATCVDPDYYPGDQPGSDQSPVDLRFIGLRSYAEPGINTSFGLPPAPADALADEVVEFAVTVWDRPFRASPNFPARFEVHIDADSDGTTDYVAFNADRGGGRDGRSMVFVRDVNPADGTRATAPYLYTGADFNSQRWALPVPAAAVGLRSDRPFSFYVLAFDAYFPSGAARPWDCSPGPASACGAAAHTMQTGALRFRPTVTSLSVPRAAQATLPFGEDVGGTAGSPSQIGLLLLFRDALPGDEAAAVQIR